MGKCARCDGEFPAVELTWTDQGELCRECVIGTLGEDDAEADAVDGVYNPKVASELTGQEKTPFRAQQVYYVFYVISGIAGVAYLVYWLFFD